MPQQQWYYNNNGERHGPLASHQLKALAASGQLQSTDLVWREGLDQWTAAHRIVGLFPTETAAPKPPPSRIRVELDDSTVNDPATQWYYALNGKRAGPTNAAEIVKLLAKGTLTNDSLLWRAGLDQWTPIGQTPFKKTIPGPPPLAGSAINNSVVWTLAFAPIIGTLLQYCIAGAVHANPRSLWCITLAANVGLCVIDDRVLKKAGHNQENIAGYVFLIPVYLYKRATALNQSLAYFITWIVCFFVSLIL